MKYCSECGSKLTYKKDGIDGLIPYCENCQKYIYPTFNSAISTLVIYNEKVLLIKQYQRPDYILVAGYITKGENAKETLKREIKEETGLDLKNFIYNDNAYYEKSNTLIHNYIAYCQGEINCNNEIDSYELFSFKDAYLNIKEGSLAKHFLIEAYLKLGLEKELMKIKGNKLLIEDEKENEIGYVLLTPKDTSIEITSVFVNSSYRGGTIAKSLVYEASRYIKSQHTYVSLKCPYAVKLYEKDSSLKENLEPLQND